MINRISYKPGLSSSNLRWHIVICLSIVLTTLAVYRQVKGFEFINFDDPIYVTNNPHVTGGITIDNIIWAFSLSAHQNYWHPLTWLSHMLDCQLFGMNAGMHHIMNLLIHIINSLLLFMVLQQMTGALWKSAFVAALFALHPINVESVAWIADRKNLLSTLFFMFTLLSYIYYARKPGVLRYILILISFGPGLLAKPMLVTLPCVLLLLDFWPLRRFQAYALKINGPTPSDFHKTSALVLILEKIPMLFLSGIFVFISIFSLQKINQMIQADFVPMPLRFSNAFVSYIKYIYKAILPWHLSFFYPFPDFIPLWQPIIAGMFLLIISILFVYTAKKYPFFIIGWLWFLGTLVPVIGIMQNGLWPAMADRWAYIPFIGLFIIFAWGLEVFLARVGFKRIGAIIIPVIIIPTLMISTWKQTTYWRNSISLFEHAVAVTEKNDAAHNNLGIELLKINKTNEAARHFQKVLQFNPDNADANTNLGKILADKGEYSEALKHYAAALKIRPDNIKLYNDAGNALARLGRTDEAINFYSSALQINPHFPEALNNMGNALINLGRFEEAIGYFSKAIKQNPDHIEAHINLGVALSRLGRFDEAIDQYLTALKIDPYNAKAHNNLGAVLVQKKEYSRAIKHFKKALEINPGYAGAKNNLDKLLAFLAKTVNPIQNIQKKLQLDPNNADLHYQLGSLYQKDGKLDEAVRQYQAALSLDPKFTKALYNLAIVHALKKEYEKSIEAFKRILTFDPDNAAVCYNIACMYSRLNQKDEAVAWLKKAVGKGYDNWRMIRTDQDIENIRDTAYCRQLLKNGKK